MECLDDVGTLYRVQQQNDVGIVKVIHRSELRVLPEGYISTDNSRTVVNSPLLLEVEDSLRVSEIDEQDVSEEEMGFLYVTREKGPVIANRNNSPVPCLKCHV